VAPRVARPSFAWAPSAWDGQSSVTAAPPAVLAAVLFRAEWRHLARSAPGTAPAEEQRPQEAVGA